MKYMKFLTVFVIVFGFVLGIQLSSILLRNSDQKMYENKIIASYIYDSVNLALNEPIIISRTMACDTFLQQFLLNERQYSKEETEKIMTSYLMNIRRKFGYIAAYVVSDATRRYYTPAGIDKVINENITPYDVWYKHFIDSGKEFDLDTDRDQVNNYNWTIFVNIRISDSEGNLLGVCGVGLFMDRLQETIRQIEHEFEVKINLIDAVGLVQVDTDSFNIENAFIADAIRDHAGPDAFTYAKKNNTRFRMTRYLSDIDWFLVIQGQNPRARFYILIIPLIIIYLVIFYFAFFVFRKETVYQEHFSNYNAEDALTKLPTRKYLKEAYGEDGFFNTMRYHSLAFFDIDNFENICKTKNSNEVILLVANTAKKIFEEKQLLFRWHKDQFLAFLEMPVDKAEELLKSFNQELKKVGITVSVGITAVNLSDSIKKHCYRAIQSCYTVKEKGGDGVACYNEEEK